MYLNNRIVAKDIINDVKEITFNYEVLRVFFFFLLFDLLYIRYIIGRCKKHKKKRKALELLSLFSFSWYGSLSIILFPLLFFYLCSAINWSICFNVFLLLVKLLSLIHLFQVGTLIPNYNRHFCLIVTILYCNFY